jgi:hypothetical protein
MKASEDMRNMMIIFALLGAVSCMDEEPTSERVSAGAWGSPENGEEITADCGCRLLPEPMRSICFEQPGCGVGPCPPLICQEIPPPPWSTP